jgi:anti-anti-sigma regulatory factor
MKKLLNCLGLAKPTPESLPEFIREVEDIRGVRVLRLQGPVGKEIGGQFSAAEAAAEKSKDAFTRPLLIDFKGTTGWDFSTVAYVVELLRRRMAAHVQVGIINPSPELTSEFEIAKLGGLFRFFASEDQALSELSGPGPSPPNNAR